VKRVELRVRQLMARRAFKAGTFEARLNEVDDDGIPTGDTLFTTRGHETFAAAASTALKKADKMAWDVVHRGLILRRIEAEKSAT
jgi:hypothetical protein